MSKDADQATIKKAYRKLARANHPDGHPGDKAAEERFKQVAEAYDVVGDTAKRKEYDEMRSMFAGAGGGFGGGFPGGFGGGSSGGGVNFDISDLFGDIFRGSGGGGRCVGRAHRVPPRVPTWRPTPRWPSPMRWKGTTISLRLSSDAPCPTCSGTGGKPGTRPHVCTTCDGAGVVVNTVGGGFSLNETCPGVPRPPAGVRRVLPDLQRVGTRTVQPHDLGAHPGRGQGRPADPPQGQGGRRRERRTSRRPVRERARQEPRDVRTQGRQPHPRGAGQLRRSRAGRRDQGADAGRPAGHPADPAGHARTAG